MDLNTTQPLWRTEYRKQFTKDMLRDLVKQTIALTRRYGRVARESTDTAEDRIHSALAKLLAGSRNWDPTRVDLPGFLLGIIASDLSSEVERATNVPLVPLEPPVHLHEDDYTGESCDDAGGEARGSIEDAPFMTESVDEAWSVAMTHLRECARMDSGVLALLDAYEDGVYLKRDVLARFEWKPSTYKRVYQRLLLLADACDPSVRESIVYALANQHTTLN